MVWLVGREGAHLLAMTNEWLAEAPCPLPTPHFTILYLGTPYLEQSTFNLIIPIIPIIDPFRPTTGNEVRLPPANVRLALK